MSTVDIRREIRKGLGDICCGMNKDSKGILPWTLNPNCSDPRPLKARPCGSKGLRLKGHLGLKGLR